MKTIVAIIPARAAIAGEKNVVRSFIKPQNQKTRVKLYQMLLQH